MSPLDHPSPADFMAHTPRAMTLPNGNTVWAASYASQLREIIVRHEIRSPRSMQTWLGPSEIGAECLPGETEVVTRQGIRTIRELAKEGSAELLIPLLYKGSNVRKRWGRFVQAPVEYFGEQELYEITLRRNQDTKVVYATAEHHWYRSYWSGKQKKQQKLQTTDLRPGYKLTQLRRARPLTTTLMPVAVAQGFTFGDGTKGSSDDRHRPATLQLHHNGKDEALLPYFPGTHRTYHRASHTFPYSQVRGLPRFWKRLPPIDESTSFLMSWLAGYFAADGSVTEDGHCKIDSAYREHLEYVRSVAAICGIGYGQIQTHMRRGISGTRLAEAETPLYRLSLRRRDLPAWFFLIDKHAQRAQAASLVPERDPHWIVETVRATGRTESVYCAITGEASAFALADDLMTGNCDRQVVGKMAGVPRTNNVPDPWAAFLGSAAHARLAETFARENQLDQREANPRWLPEHRVVPHPDHPGTADLYDSDTFSVIDWKCLGPSAMAKARRPEGPPARYVIQLLLYGQGYRNEGKRVDRVVLAALPRTESSLDGMFIWEHQCGAVDQYIIEAVLAKNAVRQQLAGEILAGRMNIGQIPITPGDDSCFFCLESNTEVVTRDGIKPIRELAGTEPELLVPIIGKNPGLAAQGKFAQAPVREFGQQQLWEITLGSRRGEKIVYATAEHRWLLTKRPSRANPDNKHGRITQSRIVPDDERFERTTQELRPGDRLRSLRATRPAGIQLMPWAVAQGFVFGDGTTGQGNRPATLSIYDNGKDEALLPFFPFTEPAQYDWTDPETGRQSSVRHIYGLPRFWKDLPPIRESRTFLLSWLAGYFAADGCISENGQVQLHSADERNVLFARDIAAVCGIGYNPVSSKMRQGFGTEPTRLWKLTLRRRDLPDWFFLIKEHAVRAARANEDPARGTYWTVKSVQPTDRIETVYCATVPDAGMFGLADDLLTGNCPQFRPESARDGGPGCPGHSLPR